VIRKTLVKLLQIAEPRYLRWLAFVFIVIVPAALMIEIASRAPTVIAGVRIGFITCLVLGIVFLVVQSRIKRFAEKRRPTIRSAINSILFLVWWGIGIGIALGVYAFADRLLNYWLMVGGSWFIGRMFHLMQARREEGGSNETQ